MNAISVFLHISHQREQMEIFGDRRIVPGCCGMCLCVKGGGVNLERAFAGRKVGPNRSGQPISKRNTRE